MLRRTSLLRRACGRHAQRRHLHEGSRGDYLGFSVANMVGSDPRFGMDMTRAPGYEVAADDDIPLVGKQKLADFAIRHARLSSAQVEHADGYMWVGSVLYPTGFSSDADIAFSWETAQEGVSDFDGESERVIEIVDDDDADAPVMEAKRRYTGGQARRIRKERERNDARKSVRRPSQRPIRKPENDIPKEDDD